MQKQTIEIDVPEGYELNVYFHYEKETYGTIRYEIVKKEPAFIEIREYLRYSLDMVVADLAHQWSDIDKIQTSEEFIRWIDKDWRKVEI